VIGVPPIELIRKYFRPYVTVLERYMALEQMFPQAQLTSWWRSQLTNAEVGGAEYSQHRLGFAFDVVTDDPDRFAAVAEAYGFIAIKEGTHVHLQVFPANTLPHELFTV
jgi:hypothetical protein